MAGGLGEYSNHHKPLTIIRIVRPERSQGLFDTFLNFFRIGFEPLILLLGLAGAVAAGALFLVIRNSGRRSLGWAGLTHSQNWPGQELQELQEVQERVVTGEETLRGPAITDTLQGWPGQRRPTGGQWRVGAEIQTRNKYVEHGIVAVLCIFQLGLFHPGDIAILDLPDII